MEWKKTLSNTNFLKYTEGFVKPNPENCKLYNYIQTHKNKNEVLNIIFESFFKILKPENYFICPSKLLTDSYKLLFEHRLFDVIYEIIDGTNSIDEFAICFVAIDTNMYKILDFLISKGFDIKKADDFGNDPLTHAVTTINIDACKYFVEREANPFLNEQRSFRMACQSDSIEIFNYFLESENISQENLEVALCICFKSYKSDLVKIEKILEKGINLNVLNQNFFDSVGNCNVNIFKFLINNGLELKSNCLLGAACINNNIELVKLCLDYGLRPNNDILETIIKNFRLPIIKLFLQYGIDFSLISTNNNHNDLIEDITKSGLSKDTLLNMLIDNELYNIRWQSINF